MAFIKHTLLACASIVCIVEAGTGPTGGFRWGNWSEWESCRKSNGKMAKNQKRRRVCMGPITLRKVAKERCIDSPTLDGTTVDSRPCTKQILDDELSSGGEGLMSALRMDSTPSETRWQPWTSWSRCSNGQHKRYRFCADAFRREIKPNRVCKNYGTRMGSRGETNKQVQYCGDSKAESRGSDRIDTHSISGFGRLNVKLSAPECYYPPGTKVVTDDVQPLRLGKPNETIGGRGSHDVKNATWLRIVGGDPAGEDEHPHIVMLSYKGFGGYGQFCDGSIIHSRYILTAAHCFVGWDESPGTYEVVVGAYNKVEKREFQATYFLESITCHDSYKVSSRQIIYDICLLKTTEDIQFNRNVWPICLPDDLPPPNDGTYDRKCVVAGWGDTRFTGDERLLNQVEVPVVTFDNCTDWYEAENILIDPEQHVCAGYELGGKDACQGDSGGPFVCKRDLTKIGGQHTDLKILTGIVSFGVGCAQERNPGVYSNVNYFLPFIFKVVNEHDACFPNNPCENGGFCIDTFHGYKCQCKGNFVGTNCEQSKDSIDACYNNQCQNGNCVVNDDTTTYRCECDVDFAGNYCEKLTNPCRNLNCNNGECILNDIGAATCQCSNGWAGSNCDSDINECKLDALNACIAESDCRNTDGSYECVCPEGFDGDGRSNGSGCQDVDECAERLHNCGPQSICDNNEGSFSCKCRTGFVGTPPAIKCQRTKTKTNMECANVVSEFASGFYLKYDNGQPRYNVECGVGDNKFMTFADLVANPAQRHPVTANPGGKGGDTSCIIQCRPGQIGQFPAFSRLDGGQKARLECLPKKLRPAWKPNKNQVRCFGCDPIPGVILEDCDVKGKKAVNCQASCENGNGSTWTLKCNKFRGKFNWTKQMFEMITNTCA